MLQYMLHALHVRPALSTMIKDNVSMIDCLPLLMRIFTTYAQHPDLPLKNIDELRMRWDWSKVKAHLIPSIAGKHEGWPNIIK